MKCLCRLSVCLFSILLCFFGFVSLAQTYQFRNYTTEDGLAQSQVLDILQDRKGYLWMATYGGVSKFDGRTFVNYTINDGLGSNQVRALHEDQNGTLWFGTYGGGIARLLPDSLQREGMKFQVYNKENGLSNNYIFDITEDQHGNLWFATNGGGVAIYDGEKFDTLTTANGLPNNRVYAIVEDSKGAIWIGTWGGVCRYNGTGEKRIICYTEKDGLVNNKTVSLFEGKDHRLWVGSYGGGVSICDLKQMNHNMGEVFTPLEINADLSNKKVTAIAEDIEGNIWLGTYGGGVHKYDGLNITYYSKNEGLDNNVIWKVLCDNEGNKWFGTNGGGAIKYTGDKFTYYTEANGLVNNAVLSVFDSGDDNIWMGTINGLSKYNKKSKSYTNFNSIEELGNNIWSITQDSIGNIWFGTSEGACKFNGKVFVQYGVNDGLNNSGVNKIMLDSKKRLWFCTNAGLTLLNKEGKLINFTQNSKLQKTQIFSMIEDRSGNFWMGTNEGVLQMNPDRFAADASDYILLTDSNGLIMNTVYALIEDKKGNIWMGTYGRGISILNNPSATNNPYNQTYEWSYVTRDDGLSNSSVVSLEFDGNGDLLIGTNNGLNKLDISEYFESHKIIVRQYSKWEGFTGMECNQNAMETDREGNVWIGTINGVIKYNVLHDNVNATQPPITHLTGLRIFREPIAFPKNAQFEYYDNHLTFEFIGISFMLPEKVSYQYKLEGLEEQWSPPGRENFATYADLSPGGYNFRIRTTNNDNVWKTSEVTYSFTVLSPFWETWQFILFSGLLIALIIFCLIRIRIKKLEKEKNMLSAIIEDRKRAEKQLQETNNELETFLYKASHDLKGPLSSTKGIINLANSSSHDESHNYMGLISHTMNKMEKILDDLAQVVLIKGGGTTVIQIDFNQFVFGIVERLKYIPNYKNVKVNVTNRLKGAFFSDQALLDTIMSNVIENSMKYQKADNQDPFLNISIENYIDKLIKIKISDNGVGINKRYHEKIFEMFFRANESSRGTGLGLYLVKNAIKKLNGKVELDSEENKFTTITIFLPEAGNQNGKEKIQSTGVDKERQISIKEMQLLD
ncbi:GHKL domain-containing protein [Bacteroidales bacterium AH-315-I05]|nr:GHKL domain-containing protein [Bacteroidales bacterium AH-315-I05]